jgi:hypothetical protein
MFGSPRNRRNTSWRRDNAEPRQPHAAACRIHHEICRLDVLMDKASLTYLAKRPRKSDRDPQERNTIRPVVGQAVDRPARHSE